MYFRNTFDCFVVVVVEPILQCLVHSLLHIDTNLCTLRSLFSICNALSSLSCNHNLRVQGWTGLPVEELTTMVSHCLGPSIPTLLDMAYLVPPQVLVLNSVLLGTLLCCTSASLVGGICSISLPFLVNNSRQA